MEQVSVSSTPAPLVKVVDSVLDVKSWITPTLEDVHGHSTPHCFKFVLVDESEVFMYYRLWSSDAWCETADALKLLHVSTKLIICSCIILSCYSSLNYNTYLIAKRDHLEHFWVRFSTAFQLSGVKQCSVVSSYTVLMNKYSRVYHLHGLPEVVAPTDVKIDLQRLKQDTPKYRPWLSPEAVDWWASFDLESVYQKSQQAPTAWPLLELMDGKYTF